MKTRLALLATTTLAVLVAAAPAEAKGSGWYLNISGGANWSNDDSFAVVNTASSDSFSFNPNADTGFIVSGAVGMSLDNVLQGLRAEVEVGYREDKVDGAWASDTDTSADPTGNDAGTLDYTHSTFSVLANAWYDFDIGGVKPYVGGGIGWADSDLDGNFVGGTVPALSTSDSGFAWQLGAGVNFSISPNMMLGVGYRYFRGPEVTVLPPDTGNTTSSEVDDESHSAVVSLTFGM